MNFSIEKAAGGKCVERVFLMSLENQKNGIKKTSHASRLPAAFSMQTM